MRVALIHDYLIRFGGAEQVLLSLHRLFPKAPIYTLLYNEPTLKKIFSNESVDIRSSFLQKVPEVLQKKYKYFLPLLPAIPETFNLRDFDLVISSSSAFAKGIIVRPQTIHICYCHNPMRFVWDYYHSYMSDQNFGLIKRSMSHLACHYLRMWDHNSSTRVDYYIANSKNTANKIKKYYRRDAKVIYPPVDTRCQMIDDRCQILGNVQNKGEYFLIVSQLAPYKRIDLAVSAFNKLSLPLIIIGDGPERKKLQKIAKNNIQFLGFQSKEIVHQYYRDCKAFIFAGEDDFGIAPVEAMSYGKPVLAFRKGGAMETIIEGVTGEFFDDAYPEILADGVRRLMENYNNYSAEIIKQRASEFSEERFAKEIGDFVGLSMQGAKA